VADTFPRQQARTRRFTLGAPRSFTVSPDGARVVFLRSPGPEDPRTALWVHDVATASEREVAAPARLGTNDAEHDLPPEERARRERAREIAGGVVAYTCDRAVTGGAFALGGRLWWAPLVGAEPPRQLDTPEGIFDPRVDPTGTLVAFLVGRGLHVAPTGGGPSWLVAEEDDPSVTWGVAEFIAAEEMDRSAGYWWAPDGRSLLAARVDNGPVATWWIADPANPGQAPVTHRYPAAGTADAEVSLWHLTVGDDEGEAVQLRWDRDRYPYLVSVRWAGEHPPLLVVEQRDHHASAVLAADVVTGDTTVLAEDQDPAWVDRPGGLPAWLDDGRLVWVAASQDTRRLTVGGEPVTPDGLHLRAVQSVSDAVTFTASDDPVQVSAWRWSPDHGLTCLAGEVGVNSITGDGRVVVRAHASMDHDGTRQEIRVEGEAPRTMPSSAARPLVQPDVRFLRLGSRQLCTGIVLPTGHDGSPLPVLMSPYGGPGAQRVQAARALWLEMQWLADQGFAVVVVDGRGTPGRGLAWERAVHRDLAGPVLEDQVEGLLRAAEVEPALDLTRVGIRGWSFGGYLAALAVLSRPDVFHAAVAGAPVTEWRLYDTYYTERFLGHPDADPEAYDRSSLLTLADGLTRPLLLIHGLADDNVVAAHTLALSSRLVAAGRPHSVLPLSGITHVAAREDVAENLLLLQIDFLRQALARAVPGEPESVPGRRHG
jgi:dipeptidyl-peptidase-4